MKKYFLIGTFLVVGMLAYNLYSPNVCFGSGCEAVSNTEESVTLSNPKNIQEQLSADKIILIDVREGEEWSIGHIFGAKHIPLGSLNLDTTNSLPKDKPIYIYCRSGRRAVSAETIMKKLGFEKAKGIGGIIEWQENGGILVQ